MKDLPDSTGVDVGDMLVYSGSKFSTSMSDSNFGMKGTGVLV